MKKQSLADKAQVKRSLIMKVGAAVLGLHIAVVLAFSLTQGCITTESQGSGRGAGARHKGPWKHEYKSSAKVQPAANPYFMDNNESVTGSIYEETVIVETIQTSSMPEPSYIPSGNTETYIVQKGDILSRLAVDFDTTTRNLISLNNLSNPDVLYVGQELRVPAGRRSSSSNSGSSKSSSSIKKGGQYEIQKGDTLSEIAVAAGVSINDLRSLNNIKDDQIFAGAEIDIPSYGKVPSTTRKAKPAKKATPTPSVEPAPEVSEPAPAPMAPLAPELVAESVETRSMEVAAVIDYVVYPGETLDDIARDHAVSKSDIMRLNNISDESAVKEGQRLRIPISE
jgi:LysM repeat protein